MFTSKFPGYQKHPYSNAQTKHDSAALWIVSLLSYSDLYQQTVPLPKQTNLWPWRVKTIGPSLPAQCESAAGPTCKDRCRRSWYPAVWTVAWSSELWAGLWLWSWVSPGLPHTGWGQQVFEWDTASSAGHSSGMSARKKAKGDILVLHILSRHSATPDALSSNAWSSIGLKETQTWQGLKNLGCWLDYSLRMLLKI